MTALLAACGSNQSSSPGNGVVRDANPTVAPYDGPMSLADEVRSVVGGFGVAELALECDNEPYDGGSVDYTDGLAEVQDAPVSALVSLLEFPTMPWPELPTAGYRRERDDGDRVLLSYDVGTDTKVAVVVAAGMRDYLDNQGWGIEWWARCDPAEFPEEVTDRSGIGVWENEAGARVPVTEIFSFQGAEHCDWQELTFLELAAVEPSVRFVRDTDGLFEDYLTTTFATVEVLPNGAVDTGYSRAGRALWLSPTRDAAYLVNSDSPNDIERWPAESRPIGCA